MADRVTVHFNNNVVASPLTGEPQTVPVEKQLIAVTVTDANGGWKPGTYAIPYSSIAYITEETS